MPKYSNFLDSTSLASTEDVLSSARGYSSYLLKLFLLDLTDRIKYIRRYRHTPSNKLVLECLGYLSRSSDPIADLHDLNLDILFDFSHFLEQTRTTISEDFSSGKPTEGYRLATEKIEVISTALSSLLSEIEKDARSVRVIQNFLSERSSSFKSPVAAKDRSKEREPRQASFGAGKEDFGFSLSTLFLEESDAPAIAEQKPAPPQPAPETKREQPGVKFLRQLGKKIESVITSQKKQEIISTIFKKITGSQNPIAELEELCFVPDFSDFKFFVKSLDELDADRISPEILSGTSEHMISILEGVLSDKTYAEKLRAYVQAPIAPELLKRSEEIFSELDVHEAQPQEDEPLPNITEAAMEAFANDIEKSFEPAVSETRVSENQLLLGKSHNEFISGILRDVLKHFPDTTAGNTAHQYLSDLLRSSKLSEIIKKSPIECIRDFSDFVCGAREKGISTESLSSHAADITSELADLLVQHFEAAEMPEAEPDEPSLLHEIPSQIDEKDMLSEFVGELELDDHANFVSLALDSVREKLSGNPEAIAVIDNLLEQPDVLTALLGAEVPCLESFGKLVEASKQRSTSLDFLRENLSEITDTIADSLPSELAALGKPVAPPFFFDDDQHLLTPEAESVASAPEEDSDFSLSSLFEESASGQESAETPEVEEFQETGFLESLSAELDAGPGDEMSGLIEQPPITESAETPEVEEFQETGFLESLSAELDAGPGDEMSGLIEQPPAVTPEQEMLSEQGDFDNLIIPEHPDTPSEAEHDDLDGLSGLLSMDDLVGDAFDFSDELILEPPNEPDKQRPSLAIPDKEASPLQEGIQEGIQEAMTEQEREETAPPELPDLLSLLDSFGEASETASSVSEEQPVPEQQEDMAFSTDMFPAESLLSAEGTDLKEAEFLTDISGSLTSPDTAIADIGNEEISGLNPLADTSDLQEKSIPPNTAEVSPDESLLLFDENFLLDDSFAFDDGDMDFGNLSSETGIGEPLKSKEELAEADLLHEADSVQLPDDMILPEESLVFDDIEQGLTEAFAKEEAAETLAPISSPEETPDSGTPIILDEASLLDELSELPELTEPATVTEHGFEPDEIQQIFIEEASEYVVKLAEDVSELKRTGNADQRDLVNRILRSAHTIKGSAAMVQLHNISDLAHKMEDALQVVRDQNLSVPAPLIDVLFQSVDAVKAMLSQFRQTGSDYHVSQPRLLETLVSYAKLLQETGTIPDTSKQGPRFQPNEIQQIFLEEAGEYIEKLSSDLLELDKLTGSFQPDLVNRVLRSAHTIKGSAAMVQLNNISDLAHKMEDSLQIVRDQNLKVPASLVDVLFQSVDAITAMLNQFRQTGRDDAPARSLIETLDSYAVQLQESGDIAVLPGMDSRPEAMQSQAGSVQSGIGIPGQQPSGPVAEQTVRIDIESLNNLVNLSAELVIARTRLNNELSSVHKLISKFVKERSSLDTISKKITENIQKGAQTPQGKPSDKPGPQVFVEETLAPSFSDLLKEFSEGEFDRFNEFDIISRNVKSSMLNFDDSIKELRDLTSDLNQNIVKVSTIANDLNREIVGMRMVPVKQMFIRFSRSVRDIARSENKLINFITEGEDTKLDKMVMEEVIEPMMHIVRNSIGHGLETPEERRAHSKPEVGMLTLRAYQKGNRVILEVEDDGSGIPVDKVRQKALEKGLITKVQAERMTPEAAIELIFRPGFSTADKVTELHGRGVGLDVVRSAIRSLKGFVNVDTKPGQGTKFIISLPLTLAISDALLVELLGNIYAIPLEIIYETVTIPSETIEHEDDKRYIRIRNERIELHYLNDLLGYDSDILHFKAMLPITVVEYDNKKVAIAIEKLLGKEEIVVKTLGSHLRNVRGVIGATILGDGRVVIILDVNYLLRPLEVRERDFYVTIEAKQEEALPVVAEEKAPAHQKRKRKGERITVLAADDSPSVRKYIQAVLQQAGIDVISVDDGLNALNKLTTAHCDIILTDLEMPRMNGLELVSEVRKLPEYEDIPIVIVTARAGEKHRRKGLELGANAFLNKPFDPKTLVETIESFVS